MESFSCVAGQMLDSLTTPSKVMGQPCLVSEAADILVLKVGMLLSRYSIIEWLD